MKKFYRYHDYHDANGCHIELQIFHELRETKCGHWIIRDYFERYQKPWPGGIKSMAESFKKWVSKTSRKRFAYPTKEEALKNLKKRKERQIFWAEYSMSRANAALSKLDIMDKK